MAKTIIVLGASYAGLTVTHKLLKYTLKNLNDEYKVVIVAPTTHFYWNLASVRAIIPGQIPDGELFASIPDGLAKYGDACEFVLGKATGLDPASKAVSITTEKGEEKRTYDILVIATGSSAHGDAPWKTSPNGYEATKEVLHKTQEAVKNAFSIVVGGAGPTGVETAAELGFEYGKDKDITLITSSSAILAPGMITSAVNFAESILTSLWVKIVKDAIVTSSASLPNGKTLLTLSNGETKEVDLYLPTIGTLPNSDFIPEKLLDEKKKLIVDNYLKVKGVEGIWAAGDVINLQPGQFVYTEAQANALAKNLDLVIKGKEPVLYKSDGAQIMAVSLGRSKGTGRFGGFRLPSLAVWAIKGRTLGRQKLQGEVSGSAF